jgi:hypothetical protein
MQGLVILFSGALAYVNRPLLERLWRLYQTRRRTSVRVVGPVSPAAAPDAPIALAAETATVAATSATPEPEALETPPEPEAEALEVVEAEIVTMGPGAEPPPSEPRKKRGPKKPKRKPGEV